MKKAIIVLMIAVIVLPFMAVNPNDTTTTTTHEMKKATTHETTTTTQADTNNKDTNTDNNNGNNTPVKHDNNNNNKTCNHNYIEDSYITPYGHYSGYVCIYCNEGYYHLIDTETKTDTNKPTQTTDNDTTPTTDTEKENYSMSKVDYNNALYNYEINNGLYCEAREHYDESGNHTETNCNYIGGNE